MRPQFILAGSQKLIMLIVKKNPNKYTLKSQDFIFKNVKLVHICRILSVMSANKADTQFQRPETDPGNLMLSAQCSQPNVPD